MSRRSELVDELSGERSGRRSLKLEIVQIELERPIAGALDHLVDRLLEGRLSIRGQPHHLVLALVHRKAQVGGDGGVEHPQRMREVNLARKLYFHLAVLPAPSSYGHRRPLAHPIGGEERGAFRRRGEKGGRGVRLVMLGKKDFFQRQAERRIDDRLHPNLPPQRILHRAGKAAPCMREVAQREGENALELKEWFFVEHHRVELFWIQAALFKTPFDRRHREI